MPKSILARSSRGRRSGASPNVPPAELDVLSVLWSRGSATARDTREALKSTRPMTHGAIVALLTRLEAKRFVSKTKSNFGKAYLYTPAKGPEVVYRRMLKDMIARLFHGSVASLIEAVLETQKPTADEMRRIHDLLK